MLFFMGFVDMQKETVSNLGTILASFLAASCCIGPAIFVIFGTSIGFMGKFAALEPMRPYLLGAGFLMLGYSFWKLYLKKQACNCKADIRARKIARGIFWFGFGALVLATVFQDLILFLSSIQYPVSWTI
jgi:mercuric ion transport protein